MKTIAASALLLCLIAVSAAAQDYTPRFEKFVLPNGLHVVLHRDTTLPLVSINMAYHAGSAIDPPGRSGLANIAGEMLLLGTKKVPREELIRLRTEEQVSISAFTSIDWIGIASVFPMTRLEAAIMIEADRMQHAASNFSEDHFETIVRNLRQAHERREQQALGTLTEQIFDELYARGHPYRHVTIGEISDMDSLTLRDARRFSERYHVPANAFITVGGNFDPAEARTLVEKYFGQLRSGEPVGWANIQDAFSPVGQGAFIREDRISFNQLHLVFPTVRAGHADEPTLKLLARLLFGSETSLLYTNLLKNDPLIQSVEVSQTSNELTGTFWITVTCKAEARLKPVYEQVMRVLGDIAAQGATETELTAARNLAAMEFYTPLEAFYGFGGRCDVLNLGNLYAESPLLAFTLLSNQQRVTSAALRKAVSTYLASDNQLVVSAVPIGKPENGVDLK
ncbi:MAG: insulinase family protein [Bacteroidetes bacterium]|nr:insulinase family protein [Bacteroidota bacterium]